MKRLTLSILIFTTLLLATPAMAAPLTLKIEVDRAELLNVLETAIKLPAALTAEQGPNRRWLEHYRSQLPHSVDTVLRPYGYFTSQTSSAVSDVSDDHSQLILRVTAGPPVIITNLDLEVSGPGHDLADIQQQVAAFPLKTDDILRQDSYEQGKARLLQAVQDLGFLDATFTRHELRVHQARHSAEIDLQLDTGVRYSFGETAFSGTSGYPDWFLKRYLSYRTGETFSFAQLGRTRLNLSNADLFSAITITPAPEQAGAGQVPVNIELQPTAHHKLRPGLGYGTDTGARASLRYRHLNLFSSGHELAGDLLLAERRQSLVATYVIPDHERLDSHTRIHLGFDRVDSDSYLTREVYGEIERQQALSDKLMATLFLRLNQERSEIGEEITSARMLIPGLRLQWQPVGQQSAEPGLRAAMEIKGAHDTLLSDTSLLQLTAEARLLTKLPADFSLFLRLQGGTTWHADPLHELPASLRFFAGGDQSVRGYAYQSLGPRDADGEVVGGSHLLVGSVELEKRLTQNWGGALFYDIGNAFDSLSSYELEQGAGFGIRRYTPVGPLRLDLARQIGVTDGRWRLHLGMGFSW